ncbi:LuxR C-terminal-related transcriptional regulator [Streptomyces triticiradicis]|uniref:Helix-turn-helix transcriptional regulator n=1 Tax=Streptomyces triticiradicis TaxID=2651189 RepID=A0A7J5D3Q3_9ACTN|nr:LuxR C-terminal-related transcriptional regulator [Streptomyces triticiradicis]KAB1978629.1 helix-turn-helix transcriptional regulator [Streptomyces triticiradicis]
MLGRLGVNSAAEAVYRIMLAHPREDAAHWGARLDMSEPAVRDALDQLSELALVRPSTEDQDRVRAVNPLLGLEALLARQQADLATQQQKVEASRAAIAEVIAQYGQDYASGAGGGIQYIEGVDAIREHLELLNSKVRDEFLTFAPGGAQTPANMAASRPLNRRLLKRGVRMRTVYLDSIRRDPPTLVHAEWLEGLGAQIRTAPSLPNRVIIIDRRTALVAADSRNTSTGAVLIENPGTVTLMFALFESVWQSAEPLSTRSRPGPDGLTKQQTEVLRLMARGNTDESIAKSLGVSARTVRRIAAGLLDHLGARSRFQAGTHAVQHGYLPAAPE